MVALCGKALEPADAQTFVESAVPFKVPQIKIAYFSHSNRSFFISDPDEDAGEGVYSGEGSVGSEVLDDLPNAARASVPSLNV